MDFLPRNWKLVIAIASLSLVTLGISAWILKTAAPKHSDHAGTRNIPGFSLASEKTSKSAENIESIDNRTLDNESPTATPAENPAPSRVSDPVSGPWLASSPLQGVATLPDKTLPAIVSDDLQATLPSGAVGANAFPGVHQDAGDADAALRLKQIAAGGGAFAHFDPPVIWRPFKATCRTMRPDSSAPIKRPPLFPRGRAKNPALDIKVQPSPRPMEPRWRRVMKAMGTQHRTDLLCRNRPKTALMDRSPPIAE